MHLEDLWTPVWKRLCIRLYFATNIQLKVSPIVVGGGMHHILWHVWCLWLGNLRLKPLWINWRKSYTTRRLATCSCGSRRLVLRKIPHIPLLRGRSWCGCYLQLSNRFEIHAPATASHVWLGYMDNSEDKEYSTHVYTYIRPILISSFLSNPVSFSMLLASKLMNTKLMIPFFSPLDRRLGPLWWNLQNPLSLASFIPRCVRYPQDTHASEARHRPHRSPRILRSPM